MSTPGVTTAVGQLLAAIRNEAGTSQREVAEAMGTQQSAVSELEGGVCVPRIDTVIRYLVSVGRAAERAAMTRRLQAAIANRDNADPPDAA